MIVILKTLIIVPPMMWVPQQQISAYRGSKGVTLECVVEAHPEALTFWEKAGRMLQSGTRFHMTTIRQTPSYKVLILLFINEKIVSEILVPIFIYIFIILLFSFHLNR